MAAQVRRGHAEGSGRTRAMAHLAPAPPHQDSWSDRSLRSGVRRIVSGSRIVGGTVGVIAMVGWAPPAGAAPLQIDPAAAVVCIDETHRWDGDVVLDVPGASFATGVQVPVDPGATTTVIGVSADGLDLADRAHPLPVTVGSAAATAGVEVAGGQISVTSDVAIEVGAVRVVGVTVVVRRCTTVAAASPDATSAPSPSGAPTAASTPEPSTVAPPSNAAAAQRMLPATGGTPWGRSVIGGVLVAVGAAMVTIGRRPAAAPTATVRRLTAGGRAPGSQPGEPRPAPR